MHIERHQGLRMKSNCSTHNDATRQALCQPGRAGPTATQTETEQAEQFSPINTLNAVHCTIHV